MYGTLTTKELKKKHSSRPERGTEIGSRVERTVAGGLGKAVAGRAGSPAFACGRTTSKKNWGMRQITQPRVPAWGNKASKPLTEKTCEG